MLAIDGDMHHIRVRFVKGVLAGMAARDLHQYVTGEEQRRQERKVG